MKAAIADHEALQDDEEASSKLLKYFRYTAYYIVETLVYMRPDQVRARFVHTPVAWTTFFVGCSRMLGT